MIHIRAIWRLCICHELSRCIEDTNRHDIAFTCLVIGQFIVETRCERRCDEWRVVFAEWLEAIRERWLRGTDVKWVRIILIDDHLIVAPMHFDMVRKLYRTIEIELFELIQICPCLLYCIGK